MENGFSQCFGELGRQFLTPTYGVELRFVVFVARRVGAAYLASVAVETIEIFTQIFASGLAHRLGQRRDALLDVAFALSVSSLRLLRKPRLCAMW